VPRGALTPRGGGGAEKSPSRPSLSFLATAAPFCRIHEFTVPKVPVFLVAAPPLFGDDGRGGGGAALVVAAAAGGALEGLEAGGDQGSGAPGEAEGAGGGGGCCGVVSHSIPPAISRFVACSRSFASAIALRADAFIGA